MRNLGLFVKTGGYLLDVALGKAIELAREKDERAFKTTFSAPKQVAEMEKLTLTSFSDLPERVREAELPLIQNSLSPSA